MKPSTWSFMLAALLLCACTTGDGRAHTTSGEAGKQTFTEFVIELVSSSDDSRVPVELETFAQLPDPDGDSNNLGAYSSLF